MKQGLMMNTVISAIVGGVIGAGVVFFGLQEKDAAGTMKELTVADLKVDKLTISHQASLLNKEGKEDVVIKEGSVLAENVILGKKFIGRQFQGHAIVANRVFTTPDDLIATPMENWRFFAEIGSTNDAGGEIVVRSAAGAASVNKPNNSGVMLRTGFDTESRPQILAFHNSTRSSMPLTFDLSEQQKQMINANVNAGAPANAPTANFNGNAASPMGATASAPDASTIR